MSVHFFELELIEMVTASCYIFPNIFAIAVLEPSPEKLVDNFLEPLKVDTSFSIPNQIFKGIVS